MSNTKNKQSHPDSAVKTQASQNELPKDLFEDGSCIIEAVTNFGGRNWFRIDCNGKKHLYVSGSAASMELGV